MKMSRTLRIAGLLLGLAALSPATSLARTSVDPNTLNPAPPDFFNAVCSTTGTGIICTLAFDDPEVFVNEPSGIVCGSTELLLSQTRSVVGKRFYDADGNLLQRHFRETMNGTFTNPDTGAVVQWTQHDTIIHNLGVPGDVGTGTTQVTGLLTRAWGSDGGTIFTDVGTHLFNESTGEELRSGGRDLIDDYFSGRNPDALQPLCDALD
jgi:hypothetical protein